MQKSQNGGTTNPTIRVLDTPQFAPPQPASGVPACASCRHQRKKCTEKCVLAPFFPAEKTQEFQAVHKVFGVSNVTKLVKDLSREDGKKAVDSLIWEATCRLKDPVLGPLGEFQRVSEELGAYKTQYQQANIHHHHIRQVPIAQTGVLYANKTGQQRLIGSWNGDHNNGISNGTMLADYIHSNGIVGGGIESTRVFNYGSLQNVEKLKQERDQQQGSLIHPQQQMMSEYSPFY